MDTARFADDLRLIPESFDRLADALDEGLPGLDALPSASRVLVLGMGSSRYAADIVARRARARGLNVAVELASSDTLPEPAEDLVVVAVSATGGSVEVLDAIQRYEGTGRLVAVTNAVDSALAERGDVTVPLLAGMEASGVACRTFRHTHLVLEEVLRRWAPAGSRATAGWARSAAEASAALMDSAPDWLDELSSTLQGPDGTWILAPADRFASAQQASLMMREVPRRPAVACETGDWSHVDVYLSKTLDYRALIYSGSKWDAQALEWMNQRGAIYVAVGAELPGASMQIPVPGSEDPAVAVLTELLVSELVAERWRSEDPDFSWSKQLS